MTVSPNPALAWLKALGYTILYGPDIAAGDPVTNPNYRNVGLEK